MTEQECLGNDPTTALFGLTAEERELITWLHALEEAASGTTIFVHRLSAPGEFLCTVPVVHIRLEGDPKNPARECGCFRCIDKRSFTARGFFSHVR